ncbi:MAG: stage II sporulation protein P [Firmicutes bacterium]|nr:stage II sporulation protein P [Bacillota bacterium]MDD4337519.1 stage II sporulation protein P [Bacillota bacterium]
MQRANRAGRRPRRSSRRTSRTVGQRFGALGNLFVFYVILCFAAVGLIIGTHADHKGATVPAISGPQGQDTAEGGATSGSDLSLWAKTLAMVAKFLSVFKPSSLRSLPSRSGEERFGSIGPRLVHAALQAMGGLDLADPRTLMRAELPTVLTLQRSSDNISRFATSDRKSGEEPEISAPGEAEAALMANSTLVSGELSVSELESLTRSGLLVFGDSASSASLQADAGVQDAPPVTAAPAAESSLGHDLAVPVASAASAAGGGSLVNPSPSGRDQGSLTPETAPSKETVPSQPSKSPQLAAREIAEDMVLRGSTPKVAILHTHTSEAYSVTSGRDYCWGKPDGVVKVGVAMAEELSEVLGIPSIHASTVHDWPDWTLSYSKSLKTMRSLVQSYSGLKAVIDIHRDSVPSNKEKLRTAIVAGEKVARILFVVTDESSGLAHPNWRKNYHFALQLSAEMDKMYPGVSRGVAIVKNARFNQHVHPGAIIVEVGGTDNSIEEACRSAKLVARALARIV